MDLQDTSTQVPLGKVADGFMKALNGIGRFLGKSSLLTLSDARVVAAYVDADQHVSRLDDIRTLDLQVVEDLVMPKYLAYVYAVGAGAEGAVAGLAISGGEIGGVFSKG